LRACAADFGARAPYGKLAITGGPVLVADAVRLGVRAGPESRRAMLLLREPLEELSTPLSLAAQRFGLSRAEAQVLSQVVNGATLAEAATCLGVARSTVKTQVEAIYGKTGTGRRAELVRLVMSLTPSIPARAERSFAIGNK